MCYEQPPAEGSVANAGTAIIDQLLAVPNDPLKQPLLTQAVVRVDVDEGAAALVAEQGPVWAELWMIRQGGLQYQLDKGFIRCGGARGQQSVIGAIGQIAYQRGDRLVAHLANNSGADVACILSYATDESDPGDATCEGYTQLSSEKEALYIAEATVASDNAGGTLLTLTFTPGAGDSCRIEGGYATHDNGAAAAVFAKIDDGTNLLVPLTAVAGNSVAAGVFTTIPAAAVISQVPQLGELLSIPATGRLVVSVTTTAAAKLLRVALQARIRGRPPVLATTVGAGAKTETVNVSKVL